MKAKQQQKAAEISQPAAFELRYWLRGRLGRRLILLGITSMLLGAVEIWRLSLVAQLVGAFSETTGQGISSWQVSLVIVVFCVVQPALYLSVGYLRNVSIEVLSYVDVARGFFEAIMALPFHVLRKRSIGETLDYSISYPASIVSLGTVAISDLGYFLAFLGMLGFVLAHASSLLMLPVIFWILALLVIGLLNYRSMDTLAGHAMAAAGALSGTKADFLENLPLIKTAGEDTFHLRTLSDRFQTSRSKSGVVARRITVLLAAVNLVNGVTIAMGILILHALYIRGEADLALFVFFVPVMLQLSAISQVAMSSISTALVALGRIRTVRTGYAVTPFTLASKAVDGSGVVSGANLELVHPKADGVVIDGAAFHFPKGARIGISAHSGSGKTTFLMAIAGLLPPHAGVFTLGAPQDRIALCSQDPHILQATIEENLLFGAAPDGADRIDEILHMVEMSQFATPTKRAELIAPQGMGLSGGQKQRLALARAVLSRPSILLLDEALSGLDENQEKRILERLDASLPDTTIIISSHRPGSLLHCTAIYMIENGRIVPVNKSEVPA